MAVITSSKDNLVHINCEFFPTSIGNESQFTYIVLFRTAEGGVDFWNT